MKIDGKDYKIKTTLYRTKGSHNQSLGDELPDDRAIETRRRFYIGERNGRKYFIKEYSDKDYGSGELNFPKNIEYEFNETKKLRGSIEVDGGEIDVPRVVAMEDNKIVFEYLEGYKKLANQAFNEWGHETIQTLVRAWVSEKPVRNYDLCNNNIMYLSDGESISLRMIDFEMSASRNPKKELGIE